MKTETSNTNETTLLSEWTRRFDDVKERIEELRTNFTQSSNAIERRNIHRELEELYIQANLIHQFLADVKASDEYNRAFNGVLAEKQHQRNLVPQRIKPTLHHTKRTREG